MTGRTASKFFSRKVKFDYSRKVTATSTTPKKLEKANSQLGCLSLFICFKNVDKYLRPLETWLVFPTNGDELVFVAKPSYSTVLSITFCTTATVKQNEMILIVDVFKLDKTNKTNTICTVKPCTNMLLAASAIIR